MPTERRARKTLTGAAPKKRENKYQKYGCWASDGTIFCFCDNDPRLEAAQRTCQVSDKGNVGRKFWACDNRLENCGFFAWDDELAKNGHPGWGEFHASDEDEDVEVDRRGHRLGDGYITPPPSTQNSPVAGPSTPRKNKKRRVEREPSPDWPDIEAVQAELDDKKKEVRELRREKDEWRKEKDEMKKEIDGLKTENSRLLAKVYPEVFGLARRNRLLEECRFVSTVARVAGGTHA